MPGASMRVFLEDHRSCVIKANTNNVNTRREPQHQRNSVFFKASTGQFRSTPTLHRKEASFLQILRRKLPMDHKRELLG